MIWDVRFETGKRCRYWIPIPAVADNQTEAICKAMRLLPFPGDVLDVVAFPCVAIGVCAANDFDVELETAYGEFCDYADNDSRVTNAEFDAGIAHYHETFDVLWELCNG